MAVISSDHYRVNCEQCPLRRLEQFREFTPKELAFVSSFKSGELHSSAGSSVMVEGARSAHLYTVLSGWGFRYKILEDGRRQILNYILPGDLVGLQGTLDGEMRHSVEALTSITLCVFDRDRIYELFSGYPSLGYDLTWIAAREESILDEHLLSIGRRSALERAAYLLAFLYTRADLTGAYTRQGTLTIPITQQHLADTLGLSIVHTNKTLRKLANRGLIRWIDRGCEVLDSSGLEKIAGWDPVSESNRPFI